MSSFVNVVPDELASASERLSGIGSAIRSATSVAAPSTTSVVAAARDEVSAAISKLFGGYGQEFQALSARAGLFHSSFVQSLTSGGNLYGAAEAAGAAAMGVRPATAVMDPLTALVDFAQPFGIFSPVEAITGRSLFVNGAAGAAGTGASGGAGGWIIGNGGNGGSGVAGTAGGTPRGRRAVPAGPAGRQACGALVVTAGPAGTARPAVTAVTAGPAGPMG